MDEFEATGGSTAGTQLRGAREAAGLNLADIAGKTRIPQRHLEAIERDDFNALPSTTYAVGFARAFARAAGADEVSVAAAVRTQLEHSGRERHDYQAFEPADPARVPPRTLAWTAAIVALLIIGGYALWRTTLRGSAEAPPVTAASAPAQPAPRAQAGPAPAPTPTGGPVLLTATDRVWLRISDAAGKRLFEKEMAAGETYTVPADANGPTIMTGRPNVLRVTVGGVDVPALGEPEKRIKGVGISADALRARTAPTPAATPSPSLLWRRRPRPDIRVHGWIILDKPLGLGSTQAVSAVKRALRTGGYPKLKVGHGGTLDPLASGVLPVAIGEATKLAGRLLDSDKVYEFTIRFGEETDTLDAEGKAIATSDVRPAKADLEAILTRFTGELEQIPPAFSALKVDGERAYDLARAGEEVSLSARRVTVHDLRVFASSRDPFSLTRSREDAKEELEEITLTAHVSKGTYIRSLARDIALALGTVGHVTYLRRIKAGPFTLDQAISLDKLDDLAKGHALEQVLLPLRAGLDDIPALSLTPDQAGLLRQGQQLVGTAAPNGLLFAMLGETPVALAEALDGNVRVVRGFNL